MEDYYFILVTQNGGTILKKLDDIEAGKIMTQEATKPEFKNIFFRKLGRK